MHAGLGEDFPWLVLGVGRQQVCGVYGSGQPGLFGLDRRDQVEPQERQIGEVVFGQPFGSEMRVNKPQPAQARTAPAKRRQVREEKGLCVPHNENADVTPAIDEQSDLAPDLDRDFTQRAGEFRRDDLIGSIPAPREPFEVFERLGFESARVAGDTDGWPLLS